MSDNDDRKMIMEMVTPFSTEIPKAGEIRHLAPDLVPDVAVPVYVVVVQRWDCDPYDCYGVGNSFWMCIPFAPVDHPVPMSSLDMATGREHITQKVIQSWNAMIIPESILTRSWATDLVSEEEVELYRYAGRYALTGNLPPEKTGDAYRRAFMRRFGKVIETDEQVEWQNQCSRMFEHLREECVTSLGRIVAIGDEEE